MFGCRRNLDLCESETADRLAPNEATYSQTGLLAQRSVLTEQKYTFPGSLISILLVALLKVLGTVLFLYLQSP